MTTANHRHREALYLSLGYSIEREEANAFGTVVHMSKLVP